MRQSLRGRGLRLGGLGAGLLALGACLAFSLWAGTAKVPPEEIYRAFAAFDGSTEHLIVRTVRLPRSLTAILVGSALAIAGAIMQGITRNPLASPGILGVNAGAAFAVVVATFALGISSLQAYAVFAFAGAGLTAVSVYLLGSMAPGGLTPLNLTLAGAVLAAFLGSVTSGLLIVSQQTLDTIRFWMAGSLAGRDLALVEQALPYLAVGLGVALVLGRHITALSLGEEVAQGLGQRTTGIKLAAAASVMLLAGSSVALAGQIGFVGLVVPHIVRAIAGVDYRWLLPYAGLFGAILLLVADASTRVAFPEQELPVGLVTPLIGGPMLIYLIRTKVRR